MIELKRTRKLNGEPIRRNALYSRFFPLWHIALLRGVHLTCVWKEKPISNLPSQRRRLEMKLAITLHRLAACTNKRRWKWCPMHVEPTKDKETISILGRVLVHIDRLVNEDNFSGCRIPDWGPQPIQSLSHHFDRSEYVWQKVESIVGYENVGSLQRRSLLFAPCFLHYR